MSWLVFLVAFGQFADGNDVWITLPNESVVAFYHDKTQNFIGLYTAYVCPRSGQVRIETGEGGCDVAIVWDRHFVDIQWNPKTLMANEDGEFYIGQPECYFIPLWSFQ